MAMNEFVSSKLSLLDTEVSMPPEQVAAAWRRVQTRAATARRVPARWIFGLSAAAMLCLVFLIPSTRAVAQSTWRSFVLWRTEALTIDMAKTSVELLMPNVFPLHPSGESWRTSDLAEAERLAGFRVLTLASPQLSAHRPAFRIEQQPEITRIIDLAAIQKELTRLERPMVSPPDGIDGAKIVLRPRSRLVVTSYGECPKIRGMWRACAFLVQARPKALELPPGVIVEPFVRFSLELAGLSAAHARQLQSLAGADPIFFLPSEAGSTIEAVSVKGRRGLLIRSPGNATHVLQWQGDEFQYELHVRDANRAVEWAETAR